MHQALLKITGIVQGVCYRSYAKDKAEELHLTGYVKNTPDGNVEALVQGEKFNIERFIEWAKQGPSHSKVDKVETTWQPLINPFPTFKIQ